MAHHQRHNTSSNEAQSLRAVQPRPSLQPITSISEDETLAELDEPPERRPSFFKSIFNNALTRRPSLLTKALHTEPESLDEAVARNYFDNVPSISSTCSTRSVRSNGDFTSDDGRVSPSTMASTPGSPRSMLGMAKQHSAHGDNAARPRSSTDSHGDFDDPKALNLNDSAAAPEATVEAKLGRKRCIMFACGRKDDKPEQAPAATPTPVEEKTVEEEPKPVQKRPCMIKFACPFTPSKTSDANKHAPERTVSRHLSPAPPIKAPASPASSVRRRHRDSDATICNDSPKTPKATSTITSHPRHPSSNSDLRMGAESCRFHEFASGDDEPEDWTQESTCHRNRLTVNDTLQKEFHIRQLAEEAEEEEETALEDEELVEDAESDGDDDGIFSDDSVSDAGFQTDDENGFAESDDEDSDSDYEWWAPRSTRGASPYVGHDVVRPRSTRTYSNSSVDSSDLEASPRSRRRRHHHKRIDPVVIRPGTPELPDSTDFVCGTLDEDRPMEQAYMSCMELKRAAKHRVKPQDIDPSFPVSDPELASDDDDEDEPLHRRASESDHFLHGKLDMGDDEEEHRGRRLRSPMHSPRDSPKRLRSPPPKKSSVTQLPPIGPKKSCASHRSPAPQALFRNGLSRRLRSPPPAHRLTSPPPSRRGSTTTSPGPPAAFGVPFLSTRINGISHTSSLPRSPHPLIRRSRSSLMDSSTPVAQVGSENEDEGSATDTPADTVSSQTRYARGAIDIAQGLERKRLKRREFFYKQYQRKECKRERHGKTKRPQPGKGAERMRQVGLDCAYYKGARMLSV